MLRFWERSRHETHLVRVRKRSRLWLKLHVLIATNTAGDVLTSRHAYKCWNVRYLDNHQATFQTWQVGNMKTWTLFSPIWHVKMWDVTVVCRNVSCHHFIRSTGLDESESDLSIYLSIYLSVCPSVCLSVSRFISLINGSFKFKYLQILMSSLFPVSASSASPTRWLLATGYVPDSTLEKSWRGKSGAREREKKKRRQRIVEKKEKETSVEKWSDGK